MAIEQEGEWWSAASDDLASTITRPKMDRREKEKQPTSARHLWELIQDFCKTIPGDYLMKLIERMPRVCKAVIKAKGGYYEESKI